MDRLHVSATSHWPNYLPEYVARELGYYEDEGLDFSRSAPDDWTDVLTDLAEGRADVVLGGLWVPAMFHGRGREYVPFAQLNGVNPKVLVTREPVADFSLKDLEGKVVLAPGAGGTAPYVHTAGLMRQAGVDMARVRWVRDLSGSLLLDMFLHGAGDALVTDAVNGAFLQRAGQAHIAFRHDRAGGAMPNSVYYTSRAVLDRDDKVIGRFCRALRRAYDWLGQHEAAELSDLLKREWPGLDTEFLVTVVDDLRASGLWDDIRIDEQGHDSWMRILADDGLIDAPIPYADLVDPRPAAEATVVRP
ncbi:MULTISPECIES: ABC transporter substrate-binding protein [unclassified Streptomyces]|uniref:ABC transporter substrate-binding protein n=1 Tax=unclassified Streptomyces TaxID=2593676 RepID=UPI000DBA0880|nr:MULTISPECIES: ABC transporter substrate-binding protein [unclassified Streptomyces]MYT73565.1 ABC transporter substrate-binding protein [Streptomyces sp. SID8367]RAJ85102.1 NitT/TauT family transport system substrate-binding protein [Streptomyces sp. PsTaAH-137]